MVLRIENVTKHFHQSKALNSVSMSVGEREFVCLLGPSGCGKTTLLRLIAGLIPLESGRIFLDNQDLTRTPARERNFGIVFQSYSLFPGMTVAANIGYGLKIRGEAPATMHRRVGELLEMIRMTEFADRYPWQLSGGQQQRVALARAVAVKPRLLLLDEPLSALDAKVRTDLRQQIRQIQQELGIPTVMVTHDQEEALTLSDRIVCMRQGEVAQEGTPEDLYCRPVTKFVAEFMGVSNLIAAQQASELDPELRVDRDQIPQPQFLCVRPEHVHLSKGGPAQVTSVQFLGNVSRVRVEWRGMNLTAEEHGMTAWVKGDTVAVSISPAHANWIQAD